MSTISVSITKGEGGFGMRISVEGVVTGYSVPGGAAEVRTPLEASRRCLCASPPSCPPPEHARLFVGRPRGCPSAAKWSRSTTCPSSPRRRSSGSSRRPVPGPSSSHASCRRRPHPRRRPPRRRPRQRRRRPQRPHRKACRPRQRRRRLRRRRRRRRRRRCAAISGADEAHLLTACLSLCEPISGFGCRRRRRSQRQRCSASSRSQRPAARTNPCWLPACRPPQLLLPRRLRLPSRSRRPSRSPSRSPR